GATYNACASSVEGNCTGQADTCNNQSIGTGPNQIPPPSCWQETYASPTLDAQFYTNPNPQNPNQTSPLVPYFDIAAKYGFANYFFQTNEGPSQPAHDFLFGGTSAPTGNPSVQYFNYFGADNPAGGGVTGCEAASTQTVTLVNPDGNDGDNTFPKAKLYPCFEHQTLSDLLEGAGKTWKYYTNNYGDIW